MHDDLLTPEEVAQRLKLSTYTIRKLLRDGKIRGLKLEGGRQLWRVEQSALAEYLNRQRNQQP